MLKIIAICRSDNETDGNEEIKFHTAQDDWEFIQREIIVAPFIENRRRFHTILTNFLLIYVEC